METVRSLLDPDVLIGIVYRRDDMTNQGQPGFDITPEQEFLQVRALRPPAGKVYDAHKHLPQARTTDRTQEALVVIAGRIEMQFFDLDDRLVATNILSGGDCAVALTGGHAVRVLDGDTLMYEVKNGPYFGLARDKAPIGRRDV